MSNLSPFVYLALLVVLALAGYAGYLWFRVWKQSEQQKEELVRIAKQEQQARETARSSIDVLLRALDQGQVSMTEAAIRIATLSQALPQKEREAGLYDAYINLAAATAHIPILENWKKLSRSEKHAFDEERGTIESEHQEAITRSTRVLLMAYPAH